MAGRDIEALLDAMTLDEQVSLLSGADFWTTVAVPRLGIPSIKVSDGPNGARGGGSLVGGVKAASFPVGIALGASWNPELVEEIGIPAICDHLMNVIDKRLARGENAAMAQVLEEQ